MGEKETKQRTRIRIIIPTFDRSDLLQCCLRSLQEQHYRDFDVLVVDDGSDEDIAAAVSAVMPEAQVLRREINGGFAAAINSGIAASQHDWVFLLNNDTRLAPDCLAELMKVANEDAAAILGPLMLFEEDAGIIYAAGDRIRANGRPESIGYRHRLEGFDFAEEPFGITAGAMLVKQEVFARVGTFDERFIAYFEDADFNFRARLAGYRPRLVREAVVWHVGSASISRRLWWRTRQCFRNHALLTGKNMPLSVLLRQAPKIVREFVGGWARTFSAVRCDRGAIGAGVEVARVLCELCGLVPHVLSERRRIQRASELDAGQVQDLLAP